MDYQVFTDGACLGNPGPGGYGIIIASSSGEVWEMGEAANPTTNNRMEMQAPLVALTWIANRPSPGKITLYSDSQYFLKGMQEWRFGWRKRGWKKSDGQEVKNHDLWLPLDQIADRLVQQGAKLAYHYTRGHVGIPGNERVDAIASDFAAGNPANLYQGARSEYSVDLDSTTPSAAPANKPAATSTRPNHSATAKKGPKRYLSFVDGQFRIHTTWPDCEARVKGRSGARFKKVSSEAEIAELKSLWQV